MALVYEKLLVWFLHTITFHDRTVICLSAKHNVICRFFWGPVHHGASHCMPVEASGSSATIPRNRVTPLGSLSNLGDITLRFVGLYMSELSIRYYNLLFIQRDHHRKMAF